MVGRLAASCSHHLVGPDRKPLAAHGHPVYGSSCLALTGVVHWAGHCVVMDCSLRRVDETSIYDSAASHNA